MAVLKKIKRAVRGEVKLTTVALEAIRRSRASLHARKERAEIHDDEPLILTDTFARMSAEELLAHFRSERKAKFLDGLAAPEAAEIVAADAIVNSYSWPLLGFGEKCFGRDIQWTRDPLSNYVWPLDYHRDIKLIRADGSDVRVLWELNRLGHFITLARAYSSTNDERYSAEFFAQFRSWADQNPYGRGPNWSCPMEVALRAINLLAAFETFRRSPQLTADFLSFFLQLLQRHGNYIRRNLEFSYIATSNHYLSDVVGLLWLGLMLPELRGAHQWRDFGLDQMLREMDKQVLSDGADFEASTGYHRFVTELLLYSFLLCRANNVEIEKRYWSRLHQMLSYIRAYLRPDGFAPLIGDTDSGRILPVGYRRADDHAYLLDIGAAVFDDLTQQGSQAFPYAGTYILREGDLYLCFNASSAGINGRGSHGHNDALSIEVSAGGRAFIVDPGTYVYSADLQKRHEFRSTAYHSTVQIDGREHNTTDVHVPFVIGNEAQPCLLEWVTGATLDRVVAEHYGYAPITHRRSVTFNKRERAWLIDDEFFGDGEHVYEVRFHFDAGLDVQVRGTAVEARDSDVGLVVSSLNSDMVPVLESQPVSRDYGQMSDAISACWRISGRPGKLSWKIEVCRGNKHHMCGICGIWEYGASEGSVELSLIARMRDEMTHRGPDDAGELIFDDRRGGFGFRRLSIIDLSAAGHQPMHGCDDRTWLVFNGEIYNHASLRADLEQRGHKYSSRTDSETILHLYEERGLDFIHEIEGDYGIALWDANKAQLVLVRDRIGVKPLYFYHKDGRFIFASEIKAILQHPAVTPDIDEEALYHYLTFLTTPAPTTLFRDIQKLPAGHVLILKRDGTLNMQRYWDALPPQQAGMSSEQEQQAEILRLLRDSIRKRMMSDVPFGVFLSGGVDSSANVALMSEQMSRPVETFTVGFSDAEYLNELEPARRIARQFGTNHHEVIISEKEMHDFLPQMVFHQDEPIADPVCVPLYYVSKLARDSGTIVVQVGEGSDEIFSGYENYVRHLRIYENFWRHAESLPLSLRRTISNLSRPALEATGRKRAAIELIRRLGADEPLFWGGVVVYDETFKPRVLSSGVRERLNGLSSLRVVESYLKHIEQERPDADFLARMTYLELKLRLPELLLMRVDKITMATSVEARVPFLDHHLVEYALGLPRSLKVEGASGKHILKRSLEEILPHDLLYERKRGFGAPVREWFREGLGSWFDDHLINSTMRRRDLLDYGFVSRMLDEHRRQTRDWGFHLWALLNLSLWYERWIDRTATDFHG